ncbi:cytochrome b5 [Cryptomeria japonica]|uniref:cytochrome b5 n=1 Tax=Cryptomeria japonica TaxID=3369 RepID=UPI0025AB896F|nr:cytochrome b5 [Cryptomeria japonica]XP_057851278.1 cytochrome b5 [Cryptomeria japonica]XP_057851279.1 cytochrome b5 [Cryptomeria japonica]XP_057851280.1 cytochrome b5 [Cryptomeria japonica]XP_057851281.1 cytochrome b5 [Cryptomeria japonica]
MSDPKMYVFEDVSKHNTNKDCWLIISGKVYDVTRFLEDHPGGDEVLLSSTGQDATDDFEDVGHSTSARAMMEEYYIGDIDLSSLPSKTKSGKTRKPAPSPQNSKSRVKFFQILVPLAILIFALAIGFYAKSS